MKKESKLKTIARAKTKNHDVIEDWHQERLSKCAVCPLNSKNKESKTIEDLAKIAANLGKDTCLLCGCGIMDKTSEEVEACALEDHPNLGETQWNRRMVKTSNVDTLYLENLSPDTINLDLQNGEFIVDLGKTEYKNSSSFDLKVIQKKNTQITFFEVKPACGCTGSKVVNGDTYRTIKLKYDNKEIGKINKIINVLYSINNSKKILKFRIRLKGETINLNN